MAPDFVPLFWRSNLNQREISGLADLHDLWVGGRLGVRLGVSSNIPTWDALFLTCVARLNPPS